MSKFKVGDKVKTEHGIGTVVHINDEDEFLVKIIGFSGHGGFSSGYKNTDGVSDKWWFYERELELIDNNPIKSILFNNPYTTVLFNDGTKSIVKCHVNDEFDEYQGFVNAVAKHTLQMSGLEIAELIESKAKRKQDNVIRVGDKVIYCDKEYYVTHIDDEWYRTFPYKLSKRKEDLGLDVSQLNQKHGFHDATWAVSSFKDLTKVKSK